MQEKRRVLMIIPNLDFGGAQNSFSRLSCILEPHFDLCLVVFNKSNLAPIVLGGTLNDLGVSGSGFIPVKAFRFIQRIIRLRKIKRKFKPDVSISFLEGADYINILSAIGERVFLYIHGSKLFDKNIKGFVGLIRKRILIPILYSKANKILVVNIAIATELKSHFRLAQQSFLTMPNFYDFEEISRLASFRLSESAEVFFKKNKVICISGRLAPEKGIEKFIQILPTVLKNQPGLKVVIVGDGPQKDKIKSTIESLGISYGNSVVDLNQQTESTVFFLGYQQNPYTYMSRSSVLALPSFNEGMPNTVVEALGLGVPVVAADCPYGPREILAPDNQLGKRSVQKTEWCEFGVLVPEWSTPLVNEAWKEALTELVSSAEKWEHYSLQSKKRAAEFAVEKNISRWINLING
ncbi:MAG TPA: glycosyltransferase [Cyclobacteriaceae bacterium]|nr:glycosyltransferase [Cyclobacteriaceae bacterium]HRJ81332.1 glycosyltransferase [Cyclobacteriaceae bacterium]